MNLGRTMIRTTPRPMGCAACAGLGAMGSSSNTGKIIGAAMIVGLLGAWAIWFTQTHPLKPQYARAR